MADTQRGRATLQTLFPDNTTGDISPQDLRDFLVSAQLNTEQVILASGGASQSPLVFQSGNLTTSTTAGNLEYNGYGFYGTQVSGVRGRVSLRSDFVTLYDEANIKVDCVSGNNFYVEVNGDRTVSAPINSSARISDKMIIRIKAIGADRTITLNTNIPNGFRYGADISALSGIVQNKTDYIGCIYNANSGVWDVVGYTRGY